MTVSQAQHTYIATVTYSNQQTLSWPEESFMSKLYAPHPSWHWETCCSSLILLQWGQSPTSPAQLNLHHFPFFWQPLAPRSVISWYNFDTQIKRSAVPRAQQQPNRPNSIKKPTNQPHSTFFGAWHKPSCPRSWDDVPKHRQRYWTAWRWPAGSPRMTVAPSFHPGDPAPGSLQGQQLDAGDKGTYHRHVVCRDNPNTNTWFRNTLQRAWETGGHWPSLARYHQEDPFSSSSTPQTYH